MQDHAEAGGDGFTLQHFLDLQDREFLGEAYRVLLGREPDPAGQGHYLAQLRSGSMTKVEILGSLRYSDEGKQHKVAVAGLFLPYVVQSSFRVPVLGRLLHIAVAVANFPALHRSLRSLEAVLFANQQETQAKLHRMRDSLARVEAMTSGLHKQCTDMQSQLGETRSLCGRLGAAIAEQRERVAGQQEWMEELAQTAEELRRSLDRLEHERIASLAESVRITGVETRRMFEAHEQERHGVAGDDNEVK